MPAHASPLPLRKCTLNLYEADCLRAEALYGHGWSTALRDIIHEALHRKMKVTVEDILRKHQDG